MVGIPCIQAEVSLSTEMAGFLKGCLTEREAVSNKNLSLLKEAENYFKRYGGSTFGKELQLVSFKGTDAVQSPVMQFNQEYCRLLAESDFQPTKTDKMSGKNNIGNSKLKTDSYAIGADCSLTYATVTKKDVCVMVVSELGNPLSVTAKVNGKTIPFVSSERGTVNTALCKIPTTDTLLELIIENPNEFVVSFCIAMQISKDNCDKDS